MNGWAENHDGLARYLLNQLKLGKGYKAEDLEPLLGWNKGAGRGRGVLRPSNSDAQLLLISLEKDKYHVQGYVDHLFGTTLFWSGQNYYRNVEKSLLAGDRDTFVFIQERRREPYFYYGRAVPLRIHMETEKGIPSHVVFDLVEFAYLRRQLGVADNVDLLINELYPTKVAEAHTYYQNPDSTDLGVLDEVRQIQWMFRQSAIQYWHRKSSISSFDKIDYLVASHIKPWRESTDDERRDYHNSLLLAPNYAKLFNKGIITFSCEDGKILIPENDLEVNAVIENFNIDRGIQLRHLDDVVAGYLEYHNDYIYQFTPQDCSATGDLVHDCIVKYFS